MKFACIAGMVIMVVTEYNSVDIRRRNTSILTEDVGKLSLDVTLHFHVLHHLEPFGRGGWLSIDADAQVEKKASVGWFMMKEESINRPKEFQYPV